MRSTWLGFLAGQRVNRVIAINQEPPMRHTDHRDAYAARTALYARVARADNDDEVARTFVRGMGVDGGTTTLVGAGIRHLF